MDIQGPCCLAFTLPPDQWDRVSALRRDLRLQGVLAHVLIPMQWWVMANCRKGPAGRPLCMRARAIWTICVFWLTETMVSLMFTTALSFRCRSWMKSSAPLDGMRIV